MEEESLLSAVSPDGVYAKRTKMRTVTGGQNTFRIIVPDTDIKLWVCTDWKGSIADTDWKGYRSGEEAVLKTGNRYFLQRSHSWPSPRLAIDFLVDQPSDGVHHLVQGHMEESR